ncbi:hypothetical protein KBI52_21860 [Microvirga sp. HBU67558]|nr:hypothetical protein [Microvirga sp. HBU67558]
MCDGQATGDGILALEDGHVGAADRGGGAAHERTQRPDVRAQRRRRLRSWARSFLQRFVFVEHTTGLGLSQVYGFVRQSGGHVKIASEVGLGTMVKLYLPRYQGTDEAAGVGETATVPAAEGRDLVLLVEDDERVRQFASGALRELGDGARSRGRTAPARCPSSDETSAASRVFCGPPSRGSARKLRQASPEAW